MTLFQRLAAAREQLGRAGINRNEAVVDVDVYARTILQWDRARLLLHQDGPVPDALEPRFSEWLARRERFEPTAYIVGEKEFWGLEFHVNPSVLIPRPETELIVEATVALAHTFPSIRSGRIADIGTGSGCIAVALARELPASKVVATDISVPAAEVARLNAARHQVSARVTIICTSYLEAVRGSFDVIVANPPYVRDLDRRGLSADVLREPHVALFGGDDGLRHIAAVLDTATGQLHPAGWLVLEFGFGQEDDVRGLVEDRPTLRMDHTRADLQGLARTAIIQRR